MLWEAGRIPSGAVGSRRDTVGYIGMLSQFGGIRWDTAAMR